MILKLFSSVLSLFILSGCSDNSISQVYRKSILDEDIKCMKLLLFPPNQKIESTLNSLYDFNSTCELDLVVSYKDAITCNSNQNAAKKAYGMPSSYLRLEVKQNNILYYSYYIDLKEDISSKNIKDGFDKMQNELNFAEVK